MGGAREVVRQARVGRGRCGVGQARGRWGGRVGWVWRFRGLVRVRAWVEVGGDEEGGFEDADLDGLELDGGGVVGGEVVVDFFEGEGQLAADGHPFFGAEVVVLEEEEQGRGA